MSARQKPRVKFPIVPEKTAAIVVDMQNEFVKPGAPIEVPDARVMVPRLNRLLDACRASGITVIFVQHILRGDGSDMGRLADMHASIREGRSIRDGTENVEIYPELTVKPGDLTVRKSRYSSFHNTDLEAILRTKGIETLIIGGCVTNVCCDSTARDAFSRDYKIIFLSDGNATHDYADMGFGPVSAEEAQRVVLTVMACCFGQVASIGEVIQQIQPVS
ncbi:MAG: cysteine hydrolase [Chloroflexi bacterium]|nr:cysteine hydrolase [Chloroflexota bacterium]